MTPTLQLVSCILRLAATTGHQSSVYQCHTSCQSCGQVKLCEFSGCTDPIEIFLKCTRSPPHCALLTVHVPLLSSTLRFIVEEGCSTYHQLGHIIHPVASSQSASKGQQPGAACRAWASVIDAWLRLQFLLFSTCGKHTLRSG